MARPRAQHFRCGTGVGFDGFLARVRPSVCEDPRAPPCTAAPTGTQRSPMSPDRRPLPADPRVRALVAPGLSRGPVAALVPRRGPGHRRGRGAARRVRHRSAPVGASRRPRRTSSSSKKLVRWANWTQYLDQDEDGTQLPDARGVPGASRASRPPTPRTSTTTTRSTARSPASSKNGQDIGYDIVTLTDWMAARLDPPGLRAEARQVAHAERRQHPARPAERRLRLRAHVLPDVAVRLRAASRGTRRSSRTACTRSSDLWAPELAGPGRGALGDARHDRA